MRPVLPKGLYFVAFLGLVGCPYLSNADLDARMDLDNDGVPRPEDCDDDDPSVTTLTWYADSDGDGWGAATGVMSSCEQPEGFQALAGDCDDGDAAIGPDGDEYCNGQDDDCDGDTDEDDALDAPTWYLDGDGDGHGTSEESRVSCGSSFGWVESLDDCDDSDATVYPDADEVCDEQDNDCDGLVDAADDDLLEEGNLWYLDADGDGFGDAAQESVACDPGSGWVQDGTDCDDGDPESYPGGFEWLGDEADGDCNGDAELPMFEEFEGLEYSSVYGLSLFVGEGTAYLSVPVDEVAVDTITYYESVVSFAFDFAGGVVGEVEALALLRNLSDTTATLSGGVDVVVSGSLLYYTSGYRGGSVTQQILGRYDMDGGARSFVNPPQSQDLDYDQVDIALSNSGEIYGIACSDSGSESSLGLVRVTDDLLADNSFGYAEAISVPGGSCQLRLSADGVDPSRLYLAGAASESGALSAYDISLCTGEQSCVITLDQEHRYEDYEVQQMEVVPQPSGADVLVLLDGLTGNVVLLQVDGDGEFELLQELELDDQPTDMSALVTEEGAVIIWYVSEWNELVLVTGQLGSTATFGARSLGFDFVPESAEVVYAEDDELVVFAVAGKDLTGHEGRVAVGLAGL